MMRFLELDSAPSGVFLLGGAGVVRVHLVVLAPSRWTSRVGCVSPASTVDTSGRLRSV